MDKKFGQPLWVVWTLRQRFLGDTKNSLIERPGRTSFPQKKGTQSVPWIRRNWGLLINEGVPSLSPQLRVRGFSITVPCDAIPDRLLGLAGSRVSRSAMNVQPISGCGRRCSQGLPICSSRNAHFPERFTVAWSLGSEHETGPIGPDKSSIPSMPTCRGCSGGDGSNGTSTKSPLPRSRSPKRD